MTEDQQEKPDISVESEEVVVSEDTSFKPKKGRRSKEVSFARPPFANEFFTKQNAEIFDKHPGWSRHFIKQFLLTGNLRLAAKQANISKEIDQHIDEKQAEQKSVSEVLDDNKMGVNDLIAYLQDCLVAEGVRFDKHGNAVKAIDLKTRLETIKLIMQLHGAFEQKKSKRHIDKGVLDMFDSTDPDAKD